ncbi:MAG: cobalamin-dependent protein [Candidatus Magnetomorum sp.]|nr:cobalamin-dependent protein [Candidatus Magnetomorum sp.]
MERKVISFEEALLSLDHQKLKALIEQSSQTETNIHVVENLIVPALERIGNGWEQGDIALSQVYMSSRICEELVDDMLPVQSPERKNQPKMAITSLEDYHLMGKRIVYSVLRSSGFELQDYGRTTVDTLVNKAIDDKLQILLISTLMLHSALRVKEVNHQFLQKQVNIKIVVGGAPFLFDHNLWREVGADALGKSASASVGLISTIMGELSS